MPTLLERPSALLGRMDMSDIENVKDAQAALHGAGDDTSKLAVWAATWGQALVDRCAEADGAITDADTVAELEADLQAEEGRSSDLAKAIEAAAKEVDRFLERETDHLAAKHFTAISKIGDDLEAAL